MEPLFIVLATQNPVEQEGTYPLPEAQMDRFLMHVNITYPPIEDEVKVIQLVRGEEIAAQSAAQEDKPAKEVAAPIPQSAVFEARAEVSGIHVSDAMERYMADIVYATRTPDRLSDDLARWIDVGVSPCASLALDKCGRSNAWLEGRDYVDPLDVRAIAADVLRHRMTLSYEAQADGKTADDITDLILSLVALP